MSALTEIIFSLSLSSLYVAILAMLLSLSLSLDHSSPTNRCKKHLTGCALTASSITSSHTFSLSHTVIVSLFLSVPFSLSLSLSQPLSLSISLSLPKNSLDLNRLSYSAKPVQLLSSWHRHVRTEPYRQLNLRSRSVLNFRLYYTQQFSAAGPL